MDACYCLSDKPGDPAYPVVSKTVVFARFASAEPLDQLGGLAITQRERWTGTIAIKYRRVATIVPNKRTTIAICIVYFD